MNQRINIVCSLLVLFCMISMYIPVIAPSYPADEYHPASDSYEAEYYYNGDAYLAKRFWSITDYVFGGGSQVARVIISLTQAMLVVRAWLIVSGQAERKKEFCASVANLIIVGFFLVKMLLSMWSCRWAVLVVMVLLLVTSIVMSAFVEHTATGYFANRMGKAAQPGKAGEAKPEAAKPAKPAKARKAG